MPIRPLSNRRAAQSPPRSFHRAEGFPSSTALIEGVNDEICHVDELADRLKDGVHVNLIPVSGQGKRSSAAAARASKRSRRRLEKRAFNATIRRELGLQILRGLRTAAQKNTDQQKADSLRWKSSLIYGAATDTGIWQRHQNRMPISAAGSGNSRICHVCDGMGGEKAGEVAQRDSQPIEKFLHRDIREGMSESAAKAVNLCHQRSRKGLFLWKEIQPPNGGTTLVLAVVLTNVHIVNIGDSRIYMVEKRRCSSDPAITPSMVDRGEISSEEAQNHPKKHYITRAIGVGDTLDIEPPDVSAKGKPVAAVYRWAFQLPQTGKLPDHESCIRESLQELIDYANNQAERTVSRQLCCIVPYAPCGGYSNGINTLERNWMDAMIMCSASAWREWWGPVTMTWWKRGRWRSRFCGKNILQSTKLLRCFRNESLLAPSLCWMTPSSRYMTLSSPTASNRL